MIIDKYDNHPQSNNEDKLLPILSNQKMNAYLKEIATICEINKELTFHIARHTFATTVSAIDLKSNQLIDFLKIIGSI